MSFVEYADYKDSGVQWLGEVPSDWRVGRLKHLLRIRGGQDYKSVESYVPTDFPVIGSGGQFTYATDYLYDGESVLLGRKGTIDKPLYVSGKFWTVDTMFYTEILPGNSGRYAYYLATTIPFDLYSTNTALPSMSQFDLANHELPLPNKCEQTQIARFLDHETAKIDALIREQERLIELLQEKRQAVISHAVTKGLDPDVPMKDSGVEWLGEVPEHWVVGKNKWYLETASGGTPPSGNRSEFYDGDIPWLRTLDLNNDEVHTYEVTVTQKAISETSCRIVPKNSVLIAMYGGDGTIGKNGLLHFDSAINQAICAFLPSKSLSSKFLHYFVQFYRPYWMIGAESSRKDPNIGQDRIGDHSLVIPPLEEQYEIVKELSAQLHLFDVLAVEALRGVEVLAERRSALISAAVTGKIDVRDWQPPTDEHAFGEEVHNTGMETTA